MIDGKKIRVSEFSKQELKKSFNRKGQGRNLSYPTVVDDELVQWVLEMRDLQLAVSSEMMKKIRTSHMTRWKSSHST